MNYGWTSRDADDFSAEELAYLGFLIDEEVRRNEQGRA